MSLIKTHLGWIEVICGSMFSGKSEELIRRLRRAIIAKQRVQIFKPTVDSRSEAEIVSHSEMRLPSISVGSSAELMDRLHHRTEVDGALAATADQFGAEKKQRRTQSLSTAGMQVAPDSRYGVHRGERFERDLLFHHAEVGLYQVENLLRRESLP